MSLTPNRPNIWHVKRSISIVIPKCYGEFMVTHIKRNIIQKVKWEVILWYLYWYSLIWLYTISLPNLVIPTPFSIFQYQLSYQEDDNWHINVRLTNYTYLWLKLVTFGLSVMMFFLFFFYLDWLRLLY